MIVVAARIFHLKLYFDFGILNGNAIAGYSDFDVGFPVAVRRDHGGYRIDVYLFMGDNRVVFLNRPSALSTFAHQICVGRPFDLYWLSGRRSRPIGGEVLVYVE